MHAFIKKVTLAAIVVTIAGVAGASHARAQSAVILKDNWFNSYASDAIGSAHNRHGTAIVILKGGPHSTTPHKSEKKFKKAKRFKSLRHSHRPQRNQVRSHSSGYSW